MLLEKSTVKERSITTINGFLKQYEDYISDDNQNILSHDINLEMNRNSQRLCPIIQLAEPKDAKAITQIFKNVYHGTYPYKSMEDIQEVRSMIKHSNYEVLVYKLGLNKTVGCLTVDLEFKKKTGIIHGFVFRKEYQKIVDSLKACIGSLTYIWKTYKNKIYVWSAEVRTKDYAPQYYGSLCGLRPIAFFPNKDIFFNQIESDLLIIIYNDDILKKYRRKEEPKIIRQVLNCYLYSNKRYNLGTPFIENPNITLDQIKINEIKKKINKVIEKDKFGNEIVIFSLSKSESYFKFIHSPCIQSIEKTDYKINISEELYVFIEELKGFMRKMNIRYFECYVSSYLPTHQKIFYDAGFSPRGYVPCLKYNKNQKYFEDQVVFNYFKGTIDESINLIPESEELLQILNFFEGKSVREPSEIINI